MIKSVSLNAWQVASFRSAIAAVALLLLMPESRRWPSFRVILVGTAYAGTMVLFVLSNKMTTAASAIFLQSTAPLYVLLLSPWLLKERVRAADLVYMAVVGVGMTTFFVGLDPVSATAPNPWLGNVLALLSGVLWALTVMGLRALGRDGESWGPSSAVWGNVIASLGCLALALPVASSRPADWLMVGYLGVFQIALAYVFLIRGLRQVPALQASLLLLLEPVLNPIWAWMVHGERPGSWSLAGGVLILVATLAKSAWDARKPAPVAQSD